jgi:hypothetical protein
VRSSQASRQLVAERAEKRSENSIAEIYTGAPNF